MRDARCDAACAHAANAADDAPQTPTPGANLRKPAPRRSLEPTTLLRLEPVLLLTHHHHNRHSFDGFTREWIRGCDAYGVGTDIIIFGGKISTAVEVNDIVMLHTPTMEWYTTPSTGDLPAPRKRYVVGSDSTTDRRRRRLTIAAASAMQPLDGLVQRLATADLLGLARPPEQHGQLPQRSLSPEHGYAGYSLPRACSLSLISQSSSLSCTETMEWSLVAQKGAIPEARGGHVAGIYNVRQACVCSRCDDS